MFFHW